VSREEREDRIPSEDVRGLAARVVRATGVDPEQTKRIMTGVETAVETANKILSEFLSRLTK
jgi:hypothetical protein